MSAFSKYILATGLLIMICINGFAQTDRKNSLSLGWGVSTPASDGNFLNNAAWTNPSLQWDYRIIPQLSIGLFAGYSVSNEKGVTNDIYDGAMVSGHSDRTLSYLTTAVTLRYFPWENRGLLQPYLLLSGGIQYANFEITGDTIHTTQHKNWAAVAAPGIGARIYPIATKGLFVDLNGTWKWAGNGLPVMDINSQSNIEIRLSVGIGF